jgi:sulfoxide reductase heme-binding subunit YedZ
MTPLQFLLRQSWPVRLRRMLGLYAFFYAFVHFFTYLLFDKSFIWSEIAADIVKRPFITVGVLAFVLMIPLAVTSTRKMQRRLGRRWKRLHQLVYVVAIAAVLHFYWLVKADLLMPTIYAVLLGILLGYRLWRRMPRVSIPGRAPREAPSPR